jgi:hypothetical protein
MVVQSEACSNNEAVGSNPTLGFPAWVASVSVLSSVVDALR